jgi:FKBP-type peptidyl-prolyl cis-trans isomerase 2
MAIAKTGNHVKLNFTGRLDDGTIFASSYAGDPLEFTLGDNEVLPAIEEAVEGMKPGERKTVHIPSDDAFGPWREDLTQEIPRDSLPDDIEVEVGEQLVVEQPGGESVLLSVADLSESTVTLDANHPLAGRDLTFDLELVDIT